MSRITADEQVRQLQEQFRARLGEGQEMAGDFFRQAGKFFVEQLLAAEVTETLGRDTHQRRAGEQPPGYRNGHKARTLRTGEGGIEVDVPQVRGLAEGQTYRSPIWQALGRGGGGAAGGGGRSEALDRLVTEMYARGLSTRDVEDLLKDLSDDGQTPLLGRSSVSRVTEALWEEYEAFAKRDLSGFDVVYLFADAVYESLRKQACCREAVLVTWGILRDGSKVLLHLSLGSKESAASWLEHFRSLVSRGLPCPLTVTTDGAPGGISAVEAMWPETERVRCWFHKMANILDKVPEEMREQIKRALQEVRDAPDYETGKARATAFIEAHRGDLPTAAACLADDLEASLAHLKLPSLHQKSVRTTNLCERGFVEERRRAKVIPRFRTERECLKLVFATLWRASERWRKVKFTELENKQLDAYIRVRQAMGKKVRNLFEAA